MVIKHDAECLKQIGQAGQGPQPCSQGQKGMGKDGWDYSLIEGKWTHQVVGEYLACLESWFLS